MLSSISSMWFTYKFVTFGNIFYHTTTKYQLKLKKCCWFSGIAKRIMKDSVDIGLSKFRTIGIWVPPQSTLYVYTSISAEDIEYSETNEEVYVVLSFIFWTLTLTPMLK